MSLCTTILGKTVDAWFPEKQENINNKNNDKDVMIIWIHLHSH